MKTMLQKPVLLGLRMAAAFTLLFPLSNAVAASVLPQAKLAQLQCGQSESCCEKWVNIVVDAALENKDPSSMLSQLPRRVDRWRIIEKRPACHMKADIEARDSRENQARR